MPQKLMLFSLDKAVLTYDDKRDEVKTARGRNNQEPK